MAITKKKRFEVLQRDQHCCIYCGRKPPYVMLEVDHIIPKNKWWLDTLDNLVTSCFDCNRWKWWTTLDEKERNNYKTDISETKYKAKNYLYTEWNSKYMWTICSKTSTLIKFYIDTLVSDDEIDHLISIDNMQEIKNNSFETFIISPEYREYILSRLLSCAKEEIDEIIEITFDDKNWKWWCNWKYWWRLNYELTERLVPYYDEGKDYILRKFSLFPNIIK